MANNGIYQFRILGVHKMKIKRLVIIRVFFITLLPAILTLLAKSNSLLDNLQANGYLLINKTDITYLKDIFLIVSIVFSSVFISIRLALVELERNTIIKQRVCLIKYNKENFVSVLQSKGLIEYNVLNIRLFVPRKGILEVGKTLLSKISFNRVKFNKEFCIKNIDGLGDKGKTDNLTFVVYPENKIQGLVGECYTQKAIVYDDNLEETCGSYSLNEYQLDKTCDIKFCLCAPLFNRKGDVISIISFDSTLDIKLNKEQRQDWRITVTNYCQYFNECFHDLFE